MEFKVPNNNPLLLLRLRLLLLLGLAFSPLTKANYGDARGSINGGLADEHNQRPGGFAVPPAAPTPAHPNLAKTGEQSVEQNKNQHCVAELHCQCPPSACECPLDPEAFNQLKNNLGPVIRQRLIELQEKALAVESAINMADQTIDMLKVIKESDSEFTAVRKSMLNGADQLRDAFRKLGYEIRNVY